MVKASGQFPHHVVLHIPLLPFGNEHFGVGEDFCRAATEIRVFTLKANKARAVPAPPVLLLAPRTISRTLPEDKGSPYRPDLWASSQLSYISLSLALEE